MLILIGKIVAGALVVVVVGLLAGRFIRAGGNGNDDTDYL